MNRAKKISKMFERESRPQYEQAILIRRAMRKYDLTERQARQLLRKGMGRR